MEQVYMERRATSASITEERAVRMTAQMQAMESSLAEARDDATAKCKEVEDISKAHSYQQDKLMHAMRQASASAEAASAARTDALHCQEQLQLYQQEKTDLAEALMHVKADCCSIRSSMSPCLTGSRNDHRHPVDIPKAAQPNPSRSNGAMRTEVLISEARGTMTSLQRDVAEIVGQFSHHDEGANEAAHAQISHEHEREHAAKIHELQTELDGKAIASSAQAKRLAEAQERANYLTLELQNAQSELSIKHQHLEQLTTDHILEAERVGQACRDAAVMAQQIDALLAEGSIRNLKLAEAQAEAASKTDQLNIWRQQASTESARVCLGFAGNATFIEAKLWFIGLCSGWQACYH